MHVFIYSAANLSFCINVELDGQILSLLKLYASNDAKEQVTFRNWLANELLKSQWLLCGNFNMVESQNDQDGMLQAHMP
jgi:hypothetical protein